MENVFKHIPSRKETLREIYNEDEIIWEFVADETRLFNSYEEAYNLLVEFEEKVENITSLSEEDDKKWIDIKTKCIAYADFILKLNFRNKYHKDALYNREIFVKKIYEILDIMKKFKDEKYNENFEKIKESFNKNRPDIAKNNLHTKEDEIISKITTAEIFGIKIDELAEKDSNWRMHNKEIYKEYLRYNNNLKKEIFSDFLDEYVKILKHRKEIQKTRNKGIKFSDIYEILSIEEIYLKVFSLGKKIKLKTDTLNSFSYLKETGNIVKICMLKEKYKENKAKEYIDENISIYEILSANGIVSKNKYIKNEDFKNIIQDSLKILGTTYQKHLYNVFNNYNIDIYQKGGKKLRGSFNYQTSSIFTDGFKDRNLENTLTFAHELRSCCKV